MGRRAGRWWVGRHISGARSKGVLSVEKQCVLSEERNARLT